MEAFKKLVREYPESRYAADALAKVDICRGRLAQKELWVASYYINQGNPAAARQLEDLAARRTGKDAALFVSSGTQGNLVSVLTQTRPGQEVILDADCHIFNYEVAAAAVCGGVQTLPL